ncbi:MAG: hypothetical protein KDD85_11435 [Parvularculaceae bacterium]|nr:hypothetical protein [Parvularculaceae bacterium]MCB2114144.1 hypothetical protein [Parvularculaceae bacterium]
MAHHVDGLNEMTGASGRLRGAHLAQLYVVALTIAGLSVALATPVCAQAETDRFTYEQADVHAACNSKDLPGLGFTILQVVPNTKGKDCYWKRVAAPSAGQTDARSAIEAARVRRDAALREVDAMRAGGWRAFWRHFNACHGDAICQSEVIRARITIEQDLDAKAARINQNFRKDIQSLLHAQIRQDMSGGVGSEH